MRSSTVLLLVSSATVLTASSAMADEVTSHEVQVCVHPFSAITVEGADVALVMNGPVGEAQSAIHGGECRLHWMTNQEGQKITVASSVVSSKVALTVEAVSVTGGTPVGEVPVSAASQDLVTGLTRGIGGCDVRYVAHATGLTPPECDVHFLTYTITGGQ